MGQAKSFQEKSGYKTRILKSRIVVPPEPLESGPTVHTDTQKVSQPSLIQSSQSNRVSVDYPPSLSDSLSQKRVNLCEKSEIVSDQSISVKLDLVDDSNIVEKDKSKVPVHENKRHQDDLRTIERKLGHLIDRLRPRRYEPLQNISFEIRKPDELFQAKYRPKGMRRLTRLASFNVAEKNDSDFNKQSHHAVLAELDALVYLPSLKVKQEELSHLQARKQIAIAAEGQMTDLDISQLSLSDTSPNNLSKVKSMAQPVKKEVAPNIKSAVSQVPKIEKISEKKIIVANLQSLKINVAEKSVVIGSAKNKNGRKFIDMAKENGKRIVGKEKVSINAKPANSIKKVDAIEKRIDLIGWDNFRLPKLKPRSEKAGLDGACLFCEYALFYSLYGSLSTKKRRSKGRRLIRKEKKFCVEAQRISLNTEKS